MTKKVVLYKIHYENYIKVGEGAFIQPINHTSNFVSNTTWANTSRVISYNQETGEFETLNSIYKLENV